MPSSRFNREAEGMNRTLDSHIKNLRRKLSTLAPDQEFVRSVYGAGYKFE